MPTTAAKAVPAKQETGIVPIKYSTSKAALTKFKKKYAKVPDATTKEGYQAILDFKKVAVPLRTGIEKERVLQAAAANAHLKEVNGQARELREGIEEVETKWYAARKAVDDAEAKRQQEEQDKIDARTAEIESKIGTMQTMTEGLLGASVEVLQARLDMANDLVIDEKGYDEHVDAANTVLKTTITQLESAVANAKQLEESQNELKKQQEVNDKQQRANDLKASVQRIQMTPVDLIGESVVNMKAAMEKLDGVNSADYGDLAEEAEMAIVGTKGKLNAMIEQQEAIDKQNEERAEREREENQKKADKQRDADLKARLPEDQKMRAFAVEIGSLPLPEVEDQMMVALLRDVATGISDIVTAINDRTQG